MSAICGLWRFESQAEPRQVCATMLDLLAPHGRSSSQTPTQTSADISLGHRLLPITPEDAFEVQPLLFHPPALPPPAAPSHPAWLVADARIDNRAELAATFGLPPTSLATIPDSAFLWLAWQRWGQECVQHLRGAFAFAVWDPRAQQLFLARDHAGDRPLYYCRTPHFFAFASTARALRACPGISSELDEEQLMRDLLGLPPETPRTRFRDIQALAPGHCVVAGRTAAVQRRYWNIFTLPPIRFRRDQDYVDAFLELWDEAVRCRLRTTGAIAAELSAGLDSGAVAASAAPLLAARGQQLHAFTAVPCPDFSGITPPGLIADEGPYAAEVAAMYPNILHQRVDSTGSDMLRELARIFPVLDIPHAAALNAVWSHLIFDRARAAGVNVMLAGSLGNFAVSYSGADILHNLFRSGRWLAMARTAWQLRRMGISSGRNAASETIFSVLPWALRRRIDPLIRTVGFGWSAVNPAREVQYHALDQVRRYRFTRTSALPLLMEAQFQRNQYGDYNASASAGWGIDVRDPTADKRLFEFCASIPPEQFLVGGQGRSLIRRAMRGRLPQSTLDRREKGTQAADWYESLGGIRPQLLTELTLLEQSPAARRLLDLPLLRDALERWPPSAQQAQLRSGLFQSAIPRGLAAGYFVRRIEQEG